MKAPMTPLRPRRSDAATGSGPAYPSCCAAAKTRSRVAGAMRLLPENASEAVDWDTPAAAATAASVGRSDMKRTVAASGLSPTGVLTYRSPEQVSNRFDGVVRMSTGTTVDPALLRARTAVVVTFVMAGVALAAFL